MSIVTTFAAGLLTTTGANPITNIPTLTPAQALGNGLDIVYFIAGIVAVIVIIIAGFSYVTSGGQSANVTKAKDTILYAVVGLVVIILAFVITQFVIGRF
jgi:hypothetical protein